MRYLNTCFLLFTIYSTVVIIPFSDRLIALRFVIRYLGFKMFSSNDWFISDYRPEYPFL